MRREDLAVAVICLVTAGVVIPSSVAGFAGGRESLGPGAYPTFVSVLLLLCAAALGLRWLYSGREVEQGGPRASREGARRLACSAGSLLAFQLVIGWLGFGLSSLLLMVFQMRVLGHHRWRTTLAISAGFALVVAYVFSRWLYLPLPTGPLGL